MATNIQELCLALIGQAVKAHLEPRCNNLPLWDNGLGRLTEGLVKSAVPNVTGDDVAAGVLAAMGVGQPRIAGGARASRYQPARHTGRIIEAEVVN
jgi:hypothetical protein